jgi:hypothetical protein
MILGTGSSIFSGISRVRRRSMRGTVTSVRSVDTPLNVIDRGTLPWPK